MQTVERVTLDMTAIRDVVFEDRERHSNGSKLLLLAERGDVELGVPPQGSLADLREQFGGDLAERIEALLARPGVVGLPQLSRLSDVTFPSKNLLPGYYVEGFNEAWEQVAGTWKTHQGKCPGGFDRWYVESHIAGKRDVFVPTTRRAGTLTATSRRPRSPTSTSPICTASCRHSTKRSSLHSRRFGSAKTRSPHSYAGASIKNVAADRGQLAPSRAAAASS